MNHLQEKGADVVGTDATPQEALRLVNAHRPHACVVEADGHGASVLGLVTQLRLVAPDMTVLVLSNRPDRALDEALRRLDVAGVVHHGCELRLLVETLVDVIDGRAPLPAAPNRSTPSRAALSDREDEVLSLLAAGATNAEIGAHLGISVNTVRTHVHSLLQKLGVHQRVKAALHAPPNEDRSWSVPR